MVKKFNAFETIDTSYLVKKADYDVEIKDFEDKIPDHSVYITTNDFNKFSGTKFNEKLKGAKLATHKVHGIIEQYALENNKRIEKLQTFHFSYFLGKNYFVNDRSQNYLVFQLMTKYFKM